MSWIILIIELIILTLIKMLGIDPVSSFVTGAFILLFSIVFCSDIKKSKLFRPYASALVIGYNFRILLLFFDRYCQFIYHLPNSGADSETFYFNAMWQTLGLPSRRNSMFISLFKNIFSIIGTNRLYGQFIIILFSIIAILFTVLIIEKISDDTDNKKRTIMILSLLPNFAILSSVFLRESLICMLITISFYNFVNYYKGKSIIYFVYAILFGLLSMLFHAGTAGLIIGYLPILILYNPKNKINKFSFKGFTIVIIILVVLLFLYSHFEEILFGKFVKAENIEDIANTHLLGETTYAKYVGNSSSIVNMILYTIPRIIFFLFSPFLPWQWRGLQDIIAFFFSGLFYLYVTYKVIKTIKIKEFKQSMDIVYFSIIVACIVFVFSWGTSNVGTATRHRDKIVTLFAILLSMCPNNRKLMNI